jgi:dTDP-4-dehydrorhamnose reductase
METVLITGGNGFVAHHLALLLKDKYKVVVTGKGSCRWHEIPPAVSYLQMDICSNEECSKIISKVQPAFIVHTAAISKPDECENDRATAYNINVHGTKNLLAAASSIKKSFFIFLSTDFVFSGEGEGMYSEDDVPAPVNYYGQTKLEAENEVKKYSGEWSIVRTVLVYGDPLGGRENILSNAAKALQKGELLKIVNDQVRTPTFAGDLCKAIELIIEKKRTGVFHISGKDVLTPYQMVVMTARYLRLNEDLVNPVTEKDFTQPARRPLKTGFNISKARRELGYDPVSFEEALKRTFASRLRTLRS